MDLDKRGKLGLMDLDKKGEPGFVVGIGANVTFSSFSIPSYSIQKVLLPVPLNIRFLLSFLICGGGGDGGQLGFRTDHLLFRLVSRKFKETAGKAELNLSSMTL